MPIVRPRLTDYYGILVSQADADFAIPFLDEDIPLYLDPFLLWRSPSQQDNALHTALINSFNHLGFLEKQGKRSQAIDILTALSECDEVGFGHSHTRQGHRIGSATAAEILDLFRAIPEYEKRGFIHFEEIQFFVDLISRDRISDIACNLLKSFLIDYTIQQCQAHHIPTSKASAPVYSYRENKLVVESDLALPANPETRKPRNPSSWFPGAGCVSALGWISASTAPNTFQKKSCRPPANRGSPSSPSTGKTTVPSAITSPPKNAPPRTARTTRSSARFPSPQPKPA
jgi:hypothetical protein